jgi:phage/conjugal plasmid C-4 type zinc finger TraR family protein
MDSFDNAQALELEEYKSNQQRAILPAPTRESAKYCCNATCREKIPEKRRKAIPGVLFCAECQEFKERYGRLP